MTLARTPMKRSHRNTGPTSDVVDAALERSGYSCEACGIGLGDRRGIDWSVQHRVPRGAGGSRAPWINQLPNLLILCGSGTTPGSCHEFAESRRSAAVAAGWLIMSRTDPRTVPVLITRDRWVYLAEDATYVDAPPPAGVA